MPDSPFHAPILTWYATNARDLPWRSPDATPWAVLVSEFMLQQTPVARVLPAYREWLARWPTPAELAAGPPGEAVRQWGRLGYPRRALRLHATATAIVERHDGRVPDHIDDLRALPGVGEYTAAAIASFAHRQRHPVLDTNVRRVLARCLEGERHPATSTTAAERRAAERLLPDHSETAARWAVAVMELGALVCTARTPRCSECPIRLECRWRLLGGPDHNDESSPDRPATSTVSRGRRRQAYEGTDRQCRGALLTVLRDSDGPVPHRLLAAAWPEPMQRERALDSLVADGLVEPLADARFRLPH